MKTTDIQPGQFYRVRLTSIKDTDLMRCERIEEPKREFGYTQKVIVFSRCLVQGIIEVPLTARDVLAQEDPSEKFLRIWKVVEEETSD
jgi:hypothetical protein